MCRRWCRCGLTGCRYGSLVGGDKLISIVKVFNIVPVIKGRTVSFLVYQVFRSITAPFSHHSLVQKSLDKIGLYCVSIALDED